MLAAAVKKLVVSLLNLRKVITARQHQGCKSQSQVYVMTSGSALGTVRDANALLCPLETACNNAGGRQS